MKIFSKNLSINPMKTASRLSYRIDYAYQIEIMKIVVFIFYLTLAFYTHYRLYNMEYHSITMQF